MAAHHTLTEALWGVRVAPRSWMGALAGLDWGCPTWSPPSSGCANRVFRMLGPCVRSILGGRLWETAQQADRWPGTALVPPMGLSHTATGAVVGDSPIPAPQPRLET